MQDVSPIRPSLYKKKSNSMHQICGGKKQFSLSFYIITRCKRRASTCHIIVFLFPSFSYNLKVISPRNLHSQQHHNQLKNFQHLTKVIFLIYCSNFLFEHYKHFSYDFCKGHYIIILFCLKEMTWMKTMVITTIIQAAKDQESDGV